MFIYTEWCPDPETRMMYGWIMIGIVAICILVNLILILRAVLWSLWLVLVKWYIRLRFKITGKRPGRFLDAIDNIYPDNRSSDEYLR